MNAMRWTAPLLFLLAPLVVAQTTEPDTLEPERFYPLEVGNRWEYRPEYGTTTPVSHFRRSIVADTMIDGERWFVQREQGFERTSSRFSRWTLREDERRIIRFDPERASVVEWMTDDPLAGLYCRFDLPITEVPTRCTSDVFGEASYTKASESFRVGDSDTGDPVPGLVLRFDSAVPGAALAADVGLLGYGGYHATRLAYARVGETEYGEPIKGLPHVPDPTPPHLYFPLAVGNEWQYANLVFLTTGDNGLYLRREITRDTVFEGTRYFVEVTTKVRRGSQEWTDPYERVLRFDTTTASVVALENGIERRAYAPFCRLDTDFNAAVRCGPPPFDEEFFPEGDAFIEGSLDARVPFGRGEGRLGLEPPSDSLTVDAVKVLNPLGIANFQHSSYYAAPIGYAGEVPTGCAGCYRNLIYARVHLEDGVYEVGARYPVATTDRPAPPAFAVSAGPNPTAGPVTLRLDLPAPADVTAEAFDALGRRVWQATAPLGAGRQTLSLDAGAWAPGLYVVRVTAGGAARTVRVVRR